LRTSDPSHSEPIDRRYLRVVRESGWRGCGHLRGSLFGGIELEDITYGIRFRTYHFLDANSRRLKLEK
jgi:hypothetical protein